jgi:hypothetical protein
MHCDIFDEQLDAAYGFIRIEFARKKHVVRILLVHHVQIPVSHGKTDCAEIAESVQEIKFYMASALSQRPDIAQADALSLNTGAGFCMPCGANSAISRTDFW